MQKQEVVHTDTSWGYAGEGPLRILLAKPHPQLLVARRLNDFLHLEPLELEIVAGGVPGDDHVEICDLSVEARPEEAYVRKIETLRPHIVGLTGYSNNSVQVKEMAELAKAKDPSVTVVVGGIHATIAPEDYSVDSIDVIVRGEGGTVFGEIIRRYKEGLPLLSGKAALSPKDPDFHELAASPPPEFPGAESVPLPRRDLVDREKYFSVWTASPDSNRLKTMFPRIASLRTSYGCKFRCAFCVVHHVMGRKYIERTPEDVVSEIAGIKEEHIYFVDDETFLNEERMTEIATLLIKRGIRKKFVSWARADTILRRPELFRLWREAGLHVLYVGLEAMDDDRLKAYKKRTSSETNRRAVSLLRELGIMLHASFMVDPDFSEDDFRALEKVITSLGPCEFSFTVFSPSPGTELWFKHRDKFICDNPYLFYDCMHTLLPTRLELGRFYAHFSKLYRISWSMNPLRANKISVPVREIFRSIVCGTRYVFALRSIGRDYARRKA